MGLGLVRAVYGVGEVGVIRMVVRKVDGGVIVGGMGWSRG